jgi:hypothetical protein
VNFYSAGNNLFKMETESYVQCLGEIQALKHLMASQDQEDAMESLRMEVVIECLTAAAFHLEKFIEKRRHP